MPTIKLTPLKTNTPNVSTNKVDGTAAANIIAVSVRKKSEKKKKKTMKGKKDKDAVDYNKRLELQCKITKINQLIPKVVDGCCNSYRKIPDDYRSKVEDRVMRNYNGHIKRRCIDHGLTRDEES
jgi:hypothetical protein